MNFGGLKIRIHVLPAHQSRALKILGCRALPTRLIINFKTCLSAGKYHSICFELLWTRKLEMKVAKAWSPSSKKQPSLKSGSYAVEESASSWAPDSGDQSLKMYRSENVYLWRFSSFSSPRVITCPRDQTLVAQTVRKSLVILQDQDGHWRTINSASMWSNSENHKWKMILEKNYNFDNI